MYMEKIYHYIETNSEKSVKDLNRLVKQPNVSAKKEGVKECAEIVEKKMKEVGLATKIIVEKDGNPVVFGEIKGKKTNRTLLFYDHYDV